MLQQLVTMKQEQAVHLVLSGTEEAVLVMVVMVVMVTTSERLAQVAALMISHIWKT